MARIIKSDDSSTPDVSQEQATQNEVLKEGAVGSILSLYSETPLQVVGQSERSVSQVPLARERLTHLPFIPASTLRGNIRRSFLGAGISKEKEAELLGKRAQQEAESGGLFSISEARLILFPLRSACGGFAWVTSPCLLARLRRDLRYTDIKVTDSFPDASMLDAGKALCCKNAWCVSRGLKSALLEDYRFETEESESLDNFAGWLAEHFLPPDSAFDWFRQKLTKDLLLISDEDMRFLTTYAPELTSRISVHYDSRTMRKDARPWVEECLPAETLLYSVVIANNPSAKKGPFESAAQAADFMKEQLPEVMQFGRGATLGRGLCQAHFLSMAQKAKDSEEAANV